MIIDQQNQKRLLERARWLEGRGYEFLVYNRVYASDPYSKDLFTPYKSKDELYAFQHAHQANMDRKDSTAVMHIKDLIAALELPSDKNSLTESNPRISVEDMVWQYIIQRGSHYVENRISDYGVKIYINQIDEMLNTLQYREANGDYDFAYMRFGYLDLSYPVDVNHLASFGSSDDVSYDKALFVHEHANEYDQVVFADIRDAIAAIKYAKEMDQLPFVQKGVMNLSDVLGKMANEQKITIEDIAEDSVGERIQPVSEKVYSKISDDGVKIYLSEIDSMLDQLLARLADGDTTIAYLYDNRDERSFPIRLNDLESFGAGTGDDYDAAEYAYDNSSDIDEIQLVDISYVIQAIDYAKKMDQLPFVHEGVINLSDVMHKMDQDFKISINNQTESVMSDKNLGHVKDQVFYTGFGRNIDSQIDENVAKGVKQFSASFKPEFADNTVATAHFTMSDKGNTFFNKWDLETNVGEGKPLKQTFYVNDAKVKVKQDDGEIKEQWVNSTITVKEGWNLSQERAVKKEFTKKPDENGVHETYNAWVKLDFSKTDKAGNYELRKIKDFDVDKKMDQFEISERHAPKERADMKASLERGNLHPVNNHKHAIDINPDYQTFNVYNENGVRIKHSELKTAPAQSQASAESQGKAAEKVSTENNQPEGGKKKAEGKTNTAKPEQEKPKRTRNKKGIS